MVDLYGFDPGFEAAVVLRVAVSRRFAGVVATELEVDAMGTAAARLGIRAVQAIVRERGSGPSSTAVVLQRCLRWVGDGDTRITAVRELGDLYDAATMRDDPPDDEDLLGELVPVLQRRARERATLAAIEASGKGGDLADVAASIEHAAGIGVRSSDVGITGSGAYAAIAAAADDSGRFATGCAVIDDELKGLERGQVGLVIACTGGGKSIWLNHHAARGWKLGLNVAYATLEMAPALIWSRILAALTDVTIEKIRSCGQARALSERRAAECRILGDLAVAPFTADATRVAEIWSWVDLVAEVVGRPVDLLLIDALDDLDGGKKGSYESQGAATQALRNGVDARMMWCWAATQAQGRDDVTRGKGKKRNLDCGDVAGSIKKPRIADRVVTLTTRDADPELQLDPEITAFVGKDRTGKARFQIGPYVTEYAYGRIAECDFGFASSDVDRDDLRGDVRDDPYAGL